MWPALTILALAGIFAVDFLWRRRDRTAQQTVSRLSRELDDWRKQGAAWETRSAAQKEALFDSIAEGVLLLDPQQRIVLANRSLESAFDLPKPIEGRTLIEAFRRHELVGLVERLAGEGEVLQFPIEFDYPSRRSFEVNASLVRDVDNRIQGSILIFHDLTKLKELERLRTEFVANVSHELRTPLSIIMGYIETLLGMDNPPETVRGLKIMERHAQRLAFLTEDLLTLSRLESGGIEWAFRQLPLQPLVAVVFEELVPRAQARQIRLLNQVAPDFTVYGDAKRLEQVLWNLVDNAIKYGKPGGSVAVGAASTETPHEAKVWVRDDGPGIPPEAQGRIFERFYRVDRARSREQGGTGLGLAIVKHIVQGHGGRVGLESQSEKGSTFYFFLPDAAQETRHSP